MSIESRLVQKSITPAERHGAFKHAGSSPKVVPSYVQCRTNTTLERFTVLGELRRTVKINCSSEAMPRKKKKRDKRLLISAKVHTYLGYAVPTPRGRYLPVPCWTAYCKSAEFRHCNPHRSPPFLVAERSHPPASHRCLRCLCLPLKYILQSRFSAQQPHPNW